MKTTLSILLYLLACTTLRAQEVLQLVENEPSSVAAVAELNWMTGYWEGEGLGGFCEEIWLPEKEGHMNGIFRFFSEGELIFTEYMALTNDAEGRLYLKLKHYGEDYSPWEEKDRWEEFKLIKIQGKTAYFDGLTISREDDQMTLQLIIEHEGNSSIETFNYSLNSL
ncbi:hypothetical protein GCM10007049_37500 [Echinicola pacifica]|uniref:DUF6265 domain-containing protein n=1 Tax=Echinicola pacifica TaxID=346377 RepID=A0A918QC66_9BACT|nr:DUF6265 family protein [Echinicola pacifica]GGZ40708.1 hypothetical protein GCM10007049_37500 [Echinicola pacifica]